MSLFSNNSRVVKPIARAEIRRALGVDDDDGDGDGDVGDQAPSDWVSSICAPGDERPHIDLDEHALTDLSEWLKYLADEELESINSETEVVPNKLSPRTQTSGVQIFLDDDGASQSTDNVRLFMVPSDSGMNTEVLTWIGFGLGPRPGKKDDVLRPLRAPGSADNGGSGKELNFDDPPETFEELLQVLMQWNDHVHGGQPPVDTGHLEEDAWKNTILAMMERARLEAPHYYETEKAKLKARITAAMQVKNHAEVERLEVLKRRLNLKRFLECKKKVLILIKAEYQKTKEPLLKELKELKVQRASLHYLWAERNGHTIPPLLEFMKLCEKADHEVQQAIERVGYRAPQVAVDAMADLSEEALQKALDLSLTEVGRLSLGEGRGRHHLEDARIMDEIRSANQDMKGIAAMVHQQVSGWEDSLKEMHDVAQKRYEAYSSAYARVDGSPEQTEADDEATSS